MDYWIYFFVKNFKSFAENKKSKVDNASKELHLIYGERTRKFSVL